MFRNPLDTSSCTVRMMNANGYSVSSCVEPWRDCGVRQETQVGLALSSPFHP